MIIRFTICKPVPATPVPAIQSPVNQQREVKVGVTGMYLKKSLVYLSILTLVVSMSILPLPLPGDLSSALVTPAQAQCGEQGNDPCDVYPVYYQVLYYEPDWTIYHPGDRVGTVSGIYNNTLFTYQWYVVPYDDPNQTAEMITLYYFGFWDIDWYVGSNHVLFHAP